MWPDNETDRDFLNFEGVADTVAEIIVQAEGRPISVGVSGAWGVGKSSMIKLARASLERHQPAEGKKKFIFVEFNAWLYQGYDDARAALLDVIASKLSAEADDRQTGVEKVKEFLGRVRWLRLVKLVSLPAVAIALGLPPIGLIGEASGLVRDGASGDLSAKTLETANTVASDLTSAARGLVDPKSESSPPREIQALRDSFEAALKEMNVTLVVLIDDLDRCLPSTTISTLEAVRLFLFLSNTAFVIAADDEMIRHAVRQHFGGLADENLVTSYFDKLIQIPIRVPSLGTQEVRAYMMMLFVENAELDQARKDNIRQGLSGQLKRTWQGERVDRAFVQTLDTSLPAELVAKLDTAERLAPLMTTSSKIAGNPRLVKRFLNALSIRMAMSAAHGVGVDEAVLAKLLLFERLATPALYAELSAAVNADEAGKPSLLHEWESNSLSGEPIDLLKSWDNDFAREWLSLPPMLAQTDLRGALYVSREHAPLITAEDRLSSTAAQLLSALLESPGEAAALKNQLATLQRPETEILMDRLLARARQEQTWGAPPILEACLVLTEVDPSQGKRLGGFLIERPPSQIEPSIVPKIGDHLWAAEVFAHWRTTNVAGPVKKAIQNREQSGNIAK
jgi:predicted KAP-like P-loop ATPase